MAVYYILNTLSYLGYLSVRSQDPNLENLKQPMKKITTKVKDVGSKL